MISRTFKFTRSQLRKRLIRQLLDSLAIQGFGVWVEDRRTGKTMPWICSPQGLGSRPRRMF